MPSTFSTPVHPLLSGYIAIRDGDAVKALLFRALSLWTIRTRPSEWTLLLCLDIRRTIQFFGSEGFFTHTIFVLFVSLNANGVDRHRETIFDSVKP